MRDPSFNVASSPATQPELGPLSVSLAWEESILTGSRWLMCEYLNHEDLDCIGAEIWLGLAGLLASESTGVKAPFCCAPNVPDRPQHATRVQ
jgi:hypothetical protein